MLVMQLYPRQTWLSYIAGTWTTSAGAMLFDPGLKTQTDQAISTGW